MDRRDVLAAGAAGLVAALAGCGSGVEAPSTTATTADAETTTTTTIPTPTPDPVPNLSLAAFEVPDREDGRLVVVVEVVNDGDERGSGTLELYVRAGDRELTRRREVSLAVGERETLEFAFESVERAAAFGDGTVLPRWVSEDGDGSEQGDG